jgi:hypothetical protein
VSPLNRRFRRKTSDPTFLNTRFHFCSVEPAVRSVADRLYVLTGGREGSLRHKPNVEKYYETGLVVAVYEFLLMSPRLAHLEIRHENPYAKETRPEQVDLWIRHPPPNAGPAHCIECGDFTPGKLKKDARKMRRVNGNGTNWFLAFFRKQPTDDDPTPSTLDPYKCLHQSRNRKGGLKGCHIELDSKFARHFSFQLPGKEIHFGYALIRIK